MPNIELYGIARHSAESITLVAVLSKLPLKDEIVMTSFQGSICADLNGSPQPFIRVISTDENEIEIIVKAIKSIEFLHLDIETLKISGFYPKS
ncbi:MAG: hypothetical protein AB1643_02345 [Patescibacteria group bacterium]